MKESALKQSILLRLLLVAGLALLLLIPVALVAVLISERESTRNAAVMEVTRQWGARQILAGPILTTPFLRTVTDKRGETRERTEEVHMLPDTVTIAATVSPEIRSKGIYNVVLYGAKTVIRATFDVAPIMNGYGRYGAPQWNDATLSLGISDVKGIAAIRRITVNGVEVKAEPGIRTRDHVNTGFTIPMPAGFSGTRLQLDLEVDFRGSEELRVVPVGKHTVVTMAAPWGDPGFVGEFLPVTRDIRRDSFRATWSVLDFNRNLPQTWTGKQKSLEASSLGVRLVLTVDEYQKNERAVKYAILFIALTFLGFFMIDALMRSPFHPVHYLLVGFALILFFVLLLSLSEQIPFNAAYAAGSVAVVLLISLYTKGVTGRWDLAAIVAGVLAGLYGFLFILLQLEDLALLLGSIGLLFILAIVMHLTRRIDWFQPQKTQEG
ncbi:MAG: cell envelope integrity protein CreD [Ignavibacteria bacterium]|nr:cell envelope integrity protein CreD [Ignavibacteria bacterium]